MMLDNNIIAIVFSRLKSNKIDNITLEDITNYYYVHKNEIDEIINDSFCLRRQLILNAIHEHLTGALELLRLIEEENK